MKKKKIFLWLPMVLFVLVLAGGIWSGTVPVRGLREVLSVSAHLGEILANGKKQRQDVYKRQATRLKGWSATKVWVRVLPAVSPSGNASVYVF